MRNTDYSDWNPRLGIAWQPWGNGKTVLRGGIGIYAQTPLGPLAYAMTGVGTSDIRTINNALDAGGRPLFALPNILPRPDILGEISRPTFFPDHADLC